MTGDEFKYIMRMFRLARLPSEAERNDQLADDEKKAVYIL
jgi:hypothetical protein